MIHKYKHQFKGRNVTEKNCKLFTGYTPAQLIGLSGVYGWENFKDLKEKTIRGVYPKIDLTISTAIFKLRVSIDFKRRVITNVFIHSEVQRLGIATSVLSSQVLHATKAGFRKLECIAFGKARSKVCNGYLTWGKLGFIMLEEDMERFTKLITEHGYVPQTIEQLLSTDEGTDFWFNNGFPWNGEFDLSKDSESRVILKRYKKKKKLEEKQKDEKTKELKRIQFVV